MSLRALKSILRTRRNADDTVPLRIDTVTLQILPRIVDMPAGKLQIPRATLQSGAAIVEAAPDEVAYSAENLRLRQRNLEAETGCRTLPHAPTTHTADNQNERMNKSRPRMNHPRRLILRRTAVRVSFGFPGFFLGKDYMTNLPISASPLPRLRVKYAVFALIGLMLVYVLWHKERFLIDAQDREWNHIQSFRWYLLPHAIAAACALLLAPMQFSDRLRRRFTKLHRVVGRVYVCGVLIGAPLGFYIQYYEERMGGTRSFSLAGATQATTWIVTTLVAMLLIWNGKVDAHRRWMTRSFSVALVFLEVRVIDGLTGWERLGPGAIETTVWACNVFALLAADLVLQGEEMLRSRPLRRAAGNDPGNSVPRKATAAPLVESQI